VTRDVNEVSIVGNLVNDPTITENDGKRFATMLIATGKLLAARKVLKPDSGDQPKSSPQSPKDRTVHEVRVYVDHIVAICTDLKKGDRVVVHGEIRHGNPKNYIALLAPDARFYKVA